MEKLSEKRLKKSKNFFVIRRRIVKLPRRVILELILLCCFDGLHFRLRKELKKPDGK